MNMRLYHGTNEINLKYLSCINSKKDNDFGIGLYLTSNEEQAKIWAKQKAKRTGTDIGAVYESEIDVDNISLKTLKYAKDEEDYNYLIYICRCEAESVANETITNFKNVDIIYGPMVRNIAKLKCAIRRFHGDDIPILSMKDKIKSINYNIECDVATFEDLERKINLYGDENNQYCFKSDKAIELFNKGIKKVTYIKQNNGEIITSEQLLEYDKKLKEIKYIN